MDITPQGVVLHTLGIFLLLVTLLITCIGHDAKVNKKWPEGFHPTAGGQDFDRLLLEEVEPISSRCMSPELQTLVQVTMKNSIVHCHQILDRHFLLNLRSRKIASQRLKLLTKDT